MIGCSDICKPSGEIRRRQFYADVLDCVRRLGKGGLNVLGGVMHAPQAGLPDWKVAVISVTPRSADPGAGKRR
jgi:hypothetical protein